MKRTLLVGVFIFFYLNGFCQYVSNTSIALGDQSFDPFFLYQVKLIDEFVDRFNDTSATIRQSYKEKYGEDYPYSHKSMLVSLFNLDNKELKKSNDTREFVSQTEHILPPFYISMEDTGWFARANAVFTLNGKITSIPLVFQVEKTKNNGVKWMIAGIGDLKPTYLIKMPFDTSNTAYDRSKYIPISSTTTDFITLLDILNEELEPKYYLKPSVLATNTGQAFVDMVRKGKLKFKYIDTIRYFFFQVPNFVFTVEHFNRKNLNSGWLINNVVKVKDPEKDSLWQTLLFDKSKKIGFPDTSLLMKQSIDIVRKFTESLNYYYHDTLAIAKRIDSIDIYLQSKSNILTNDFVLDNNNSKNDSMIIGAKNFLIYVTGKHIDKSIDFITSDMKAFLDHVEEDNVYLYVSYAVNYNKLDKSGQNVLYSTKKCSVGVVANKINTGWKIQLNSLTYN